MDNQRFDELARQLATGVNRRGILKGLLAGGLAAALGAHSREARAGQEKQALCHATGDPANPYVVIEVAEPAWETHFAHGDRPYAGCAGMCGGVSDGCGGQCTGPCPAGQICLPNGTCAIPCPNGNADCAAAGCAGNRCIATSEGNVCSLGQASGSCGGDNAECPTGRACSGAVCEVVC